MASLSKLYAALDARFPFHRAESWDKVGLLVGDKSASINRALVCYEVTDAALDLADEHGCDAVVAYHPLIFRPLEKLDFSDRTARLCARLIRAGQSLICVHTALDGATPPHALGDALARQLGIHDAHPPSNASTQKLVKIVVFVPADSVEDVCDALWDTGAGQIGKYDQASFQSEGRGTFRPLEGAEPRAGKIGEQHKESEVRLEVVAPEEKWQRIVAAMKNAHPYEEVAYDVIALQNTDTNQRFGPLRVGTTDISRGDATLEFWVERAKSAFGLPSVRTCIPDAETGVLVEPPYSYPFVACSPGSGASFISSLHPGTIFISGDFKHHDALLAKSRGVALIDVTHAATETTTVELMAAAIENCVEVVRETPRNPFDFA